MTRTAQIYIYHSANIASGLGRLMAGRRNEIVTKDIDRRLVHYNVPRSKTDPFPNPFLLDPLVKIST